MVPLVKCLLYKHEDLSVYLLQPGKWHMSVTPKLESDIGRYLGLASTQFSTKGEFQVQ